MSGQKPNSIVQSMPTVRGQSQWVETDTKSVYFNNIFLFSNFFLVSTRKKIPPIQRGVRWGSRICASGVREKCVGSQGEPHWFLPFFSWISQIHLWIWSVQNKAKYVSWCYININKKKCTLTKFSLKVGWKHLRLRWCISAM